MDDPQRADTRLLDTLERLLAITGADLKLALTHSSDLIASALNADKVDAFLYEPSRNWLVALGTSNQPLSALQKKHGLDVLHVANGGRVVHVFETDRTFVTGRLREDPDELRGIKDVLRIQSKLGVPLHVGAELRGVVMIASLEPDFFTPEDVRFAESVVRWVGIVAHRTELLEQITREAVEQGRRSVAEELVTVLAHDLRNYLAPLTYRLQLLCQRSERDRRLDDLRELQKGQQTVSRIGDLIGDLLDVARLDQGAFDVKLEPIELGALVGTAANAMGTSEHVVEVRAAEEVSCSGDPSRLAQCVENLIANALQHSPKGGGVTITVSREARTDGEWARVEVVDEGPGIPPEVLPRLFKRLTTGTQREGGLGLGLYLAKRIALAHGGDLTVESEPGHGARFRLVLPCSNAP